MVLICMAVKQDVLYRLYAVWLLASWANVVLSVVVGLIPKSAVMLDATWMCHNAAETGSGLPAVPVCCAASTP